MENESIRKKGRMDRRSMVRNGTALLGAGLVGSFAFPPVETSGKFPNNIFNVRDFGATGKRDDNATMAVRSTIDSCNSAGGGTVYVPPGDYTVGTLQLKDNVNLNIEAGATLFLSQDAADFIQGSRTMIFAEGAENIAVTGRGTLDGLAQYEFVEMRGIDPEIATEIEIARKAGVDMRRYYRTGMQTYMFILNNCTNILLSDISVINSPLWNIRLNDCNRVFIRGVYIYSDLEKGVNADGIDICCTSNVTISDSLIVTGDDAIVLKTPERRGQDKVSPVENVVVTNCVLTSSSTPLMIGTETFADIRHVIFSNCTIRNSNKGFGINVQDGATVSDIIFRNLTIETNRRHWNWWGSAELFKFKLSKRIETSKLGRVRDIVVETIISHPRGTSTIKGHPDQPIENIRMNNVQIFMEPEDAIDKRSSHALLIENTKGLFIRDMTVKWDEGNPEPAWKSALFLKNVSGFEIRSFSGRQGLINGSDPAIHLENISDGLIAESKAEPGCKAFIRVSKAERRNVVLRNNNTSNAAKLVSYE
ncbi:MAG: right-handed parallel beta-helix repeat-containing protein [Bacteroidales bacterium]|nr:right-handed parallel beta-helix repeat-containing protein [Bacteroidales bacterium]